MLTSVTTLYLLLITYFNNIKNKTPIKISKKQKFYKIMQKNTKTPIKILLKKYPIQIYKSKLIHI